MHLTRFTISQDGQTIASAAVMELAVNAAKSYAANTGKPVSVVGHVDGGGTREAIFKPDGTNEKIWSIDKSRPLVPTVGQIYVNRGGGRYLCLARSTAMGVEGMEQTVHLRWSKFQDFLEAVRRV